MSLPITHIIKELESPTSIIPIIKALYQDKSLLAQASKTQLNHIAARSVLLLNSKSHYHQWCGLNLINCLVFNPQLLALEGNNFFIHILKFLENLNPGSSTSIISSCINVLNNLCVQIRGKPTLTREILTPKLPMLIEYLIQQLSLNPSLIIVFLIDLIQNHPTTFRPFGNKLSKKIHVLLTSDLDLPASLQQNLFKCLATLPQIEKNEPEQNWSMNLHNHIKELCKVLLIYKEFLNFSDDQELNNLFKNFNLTETTDLFPSLDIDINEPVTILQISKRVELLLGLIHAYLTTSTPYPVKVPVGYIVILSDIITSINLKFLKFNRDIREDSVKNIVELTLLHNYNNLILLLADLPQVYKQSLVPHISSIISFIEALIPLKNKKIDVPKILQNELYYVGLINCVTNYLSLVNVYSEHTQFLRIIDLSMILVQPRLNDSLVIEPTNTKQNEQGHKKKAKKNKTTPLSDLLSHKHLFNIEVPQSTVVAVQRFMNQMISKVNLPPTQHLKILKYLIVEIQQSKSHGISSDLTNMMRNAILFPGFDKICILPIASSLLSDDDLISVFNNPRFPTMSQFNPQKDNNDFGDFENLKVDEQSEESEDEDETPTKRRKTEELEIDIEMKEVEIEDESKIFKSSKVIVTNEISFPEQKPQVKTEFVEMVDDNIDKIKQIVDKANDGAVVENNNNGGDDSDFEIPNLEVGSDSDSDSE